MKKIITLIALLAIAGTASADLINGNFQNGGITSNKYNSIVGGPEFLDVGWVNKEHWGIGTNGANYYLYNHSAGWVTTNNLQATYGFGQSWSESSGLPTNAAIYFEIVADDYVGNVDDPTLHIEVFGVNGTWYDWEQLQLNNNTGFPSSLEYVLNDYVDISVGNGDYSTSFTNLSGYTQYAIRITHQTTTTEWRGDIIGLDNIAVVTSFKSVLPYVDITNQDASVLYEINQYTIDGTNNANVVGTMSWSNQLTGIQGTLSATSSWTITNIALNVGMNVIVVSGTNVNGTVSSDSISITRFNLLPVGNIINGDFQNGLILTNTYGSINGAYLDMGWVNKEYWGIGTNGANYYVYNSSAGWTPDNNLAVQYSFAQYWSLPPGLPTNASVFFDVVVDDYMGNVADPEIRVELFGVSNIWYSWDQLLLVNGTNYPSFLIPLMDDYVDVSSGTDSYSTVDADLSGFAQYAIRISHHTTTTEWRGDYIGLDNISITEIPEPVLLGLLGLGILALIRKK